MLRSFYDSPGTSESVRIVYNQVMARRGRRKKRQAVADAQPRPSAAKQSIVFASLLTAIVLICFPVSYDVNDDYSVIQALSGSDGFPAVTHVPFISRPLTTVLHALYRGWPKVPWFGIGIYLTTAAAIALLARSLLFDPRLKGRNIGCFAIVMPLAIRSLYSITFTSAALLLEISGALYLYVRLKNAEANRRDVVLVLITTMIAYAWRWKLSLYFAVFYLPCLLYVERTHWRRAAFVIALFLTFVALDRTWNWQASTKLDHQYQAVYRLRGQFHDIGHRRPDSAQSPALRAANWTMNDYRMFHDHWMLYDDEKLNAETLRAFQRGSQESGNHSILQKFKQSLRLAYNSNRSFLLIVVIGMVVILISRREEGSALVDKKQLTAMLLIGIPFVVLVCTRFIPRVSLPTILMVAGMAAWNLGPFLRDSAARRNISTILCIVAFLAASKMFWDDWQAHIGARKQRLFVMEYLDTLTLLKPDATLIRMQPGLGFRSAARNPLQVEKRKRQFRTMPAGWQVGSQHYRAALKSLKARSGKEMLRKCLNNPKVILVLYTPASFDRQRQVIDDWQTYLKNNIDPNCQLKLYLSTRSNGQRLSAYRLTRAAKKGGSKGDRKKKK